MFYACSLLVTKNVGSKAHSDARAQIKDTKKSVTHDETYNNI